MNNLKTPNKQSHSPQNHLEGAVVEGVAAHHPHDLVLHHGLVGGARQGRPEGLDAGHHPEGLSGRHRQRAVRTYTETATERVFNSVIYIYFAFLLFAHFANVNVCCSCQ